MGLVGLVGSVGGLGEVGVGVGGEGCRCCGCSSCCCCCTGDAGDGDVAGEAALRFSPFGGSVMGASVVVVAVGSVLLLASVGSPGEAFRPAMAAGRAVSSVSGLDWNAPTLPACAPAEVPLPSIALKYCSISAIASSSGLCVALKLSRNRMLPLLKPN